MHPLHKKLSLLAVLFSGTPSRVSAYHRQLPPSSRNPGDLAPGCSMTPFYEDGRGIVLNGKSIPCLPLSCPVGNPPYSWCYINFFASSYNTAVEGNLSCTSPQTSVCVYLGHGTCASIFEKSTPFLYRSETSYSENSCPLDFIVWAKGEHAPPIQTVPNAAYPYYSCF